MKRLFSTRRGVFAVLAGLGAAALTGMALAAIPASDGIIRGCYAKSGDLRVSTSSRAVTSTRRR